MRKIINDLPYVIDNFGPIGELILVAGPHHHKLYNLKTTLNLLEFALKEKAGLERNEKGDLVTIWGCEESLSNTQQILDTIKTLFPKE